jgi:hypothetical protein
MLPKIVNLMIKHQKYNRFTLINKNLDNLKFSFTNVIFFYFDGFEIFKHLKYLNKY